MTLTDNEIERVLTRVQAAFPAFSQWQYNNSINASYDGFTIWGRLEIGPDEDTPVAFFVTLNARERGWRGSFTVGKHSYFWSSADMGDARLLGTELCPTPEGAISSLKRRIAELCLVLGVR